MYSIVIENSVFVRDARPAFGAAAAAAGFKKVKETYGDHATYGIASGRAPHEAAYSMQKFIRAGYGTNYIDNCSRA